MALLIADSGSTKTEWVLIDPDGQQLVYHTAGINPFIKTEEEVCHILEYELSDIDKSIVSDIVFYGAGIKNEGKAAFVCSILKKSFPKSSITAYSDLVGAARALCGDDKGLCGILGTGSNCCYYDGEEIHIHHPSLGYILGDEGSGTHLGKLVLQHYFYQTFEPELQVAFENKYGNDIIVILDRIYKGQAPNQYLASFATFLADHRGHYMIENIIEDCFVAYHEKHILKYREAWQHPIHFIGSVAYEFQDVLKQLHVEYGLTTGNILKSPMEGLLKYHSNHVLG